MAKKYLDENGVTYLFNKITAKIPIKTSSLANDSGFVTESELTAKKYLTAVPSEYVTETELAAKGYLTEHQDLSDYATKDELFSGSYNDLTNKPTIPTVPTNVSAFTNDKGYITSIPSEYVTETELAAKGYLTEHQSLANYYTKTQVDSAITTAINNITNGDEVKY